jgi:prepilin signal peptidase PulO-like enzyme (type II secretory pathway)
MLYFWILIVFLFGSALGSFILVITDRFNTGLKFFKGRSICFSCNTQLRRADLVPIFSFIFLKGRCRYCQSKIPVDIFITEAVMGILTVLVALKLGIFDNFQSIFQFSILTAIFGVILLISVYDLRHFIIPDSFLIAFFAFSLLYNWILASSFWLLLIHFISGVIVALPFLILFFISKGRWLGFGDVKYIFVIGFFLGLANGVSAVILAFWIGAVFSLGLLALKKININLPMFKNALTIKSEIPFGPFLSLGILLAFLFNLDIFHINFILEVFLN